jgi:hypothetical protein
MRCSRPRASARRRSSCRSWRHSHDRLVRWMPSDVRVSEGVHRAPVRAWASWRELISDVGSGRAFAARPLDACGGHGDTTAGGVAPMPSNIARPPPADRSDRPPGHGPRSPAGALGIVPVPTHVRLPDARDFRRFPVDFDGTLPVASRGARRSARTASVTRRASSAAPRRSNIAPASRSSSRGPTPTAASPAPGLLAVSAGPARAAVR